MNDEIESEEINMGLMLNRFHCKYHKRTSVIVFRGENYFVLDCGCTYEAGVFGTLWKGTTQEVTSD